MDKRREVMVAVSGGEVRCGSDGFQRGGER